MAHQAADLAYPQQAVELAGASVEGRRYTRASQRERALLGVVRARSLATHGRGREARKALLRAEDDLGAAKPGDDEPSRVWFFSEAALAHETARTLWALGELNGAESEFQRSVRTRKADTFSRTHAVTLGYLGALEAQQGSVEAACHVWHQALDVMQDVQSGRARETVVTMRRMLSPYRKRGIGAVADLDERARHVLGRVT
ncbi:hypothetical protein [Streptomonospora litoralis]|uniref:Protein involved in sporulation n=1 Tax=Streptomonospora litoralis TaxID=2498135 RepID=A0A4P6Q457_9ACTN|nr:hypothetical protein [Streptomonospora litoralis]QBI55476.1 Protein involved in sporulation [Streptomonospora litoralis]